MDIPHIPVLRQGKVYESLNKADVTDHRTAAVLARIDRVNLGPIPITKVQWDQPHEGNLFEFLYKRRSIQKAAI